MSKNIFSAAVVSILLLAWVAAIAGMVVRVIKNKYVPVKTVKAVVVDKYKSETFSKYSGNGKRLQHVIVFSVEGRDVSFYVSEFSYNGYSVNEEGTLTYKGDRLIGFH